MILLHGYGGNESDLFSLSQLAGNNFLIFSLRAPNVANGGGFAWYPMEFLVGQKFKYNYEKTVASRQEISAFISNACKAYGADSTQVYLMGFSQGAIMSYDVAFSRPDKIKGILALSGRMLDETKLLDTDWTMAANTKVFIGHGNADEVIKVNDAIKANEFLKTKHFADLVYKSYPSAHRISKEEQTDIQSWLREAIMSDKKSKK